MEETLWLPLIVGSAVVLILGILWTWSHQTKVIIETNTKKVLSTQKTNAEMDIAKIQFEAKKLEIHSKENISLAQNATESKKNELDYEIKSKEIILKKSELETRIEEQQLIQKGVSDRNQLEWQTKADLASLEQSFKNRELTSKMDMFDKSLEFETRKHSDLSNLRKREIKFKCAELDSNVTTRKYLADKEFESRVLTEEHKDNRLKCKIGASIEMHRDQLSFQKDELSERIEIGKREIESNERRYLAKLDFKRDYEAEKTKRSAIEAEFNPINTLIQGATTVLGNKLGGALGNLGGGGRAIRCREELLPD